MRSSNISRKIARATFIETLESRRLLAGHWYGLTPTRMAWADAEQFAVDHGGHLVSITSQAEQDFIKQFHDANNHSDDFDSLWIGLSRGPDSEWVWTDGEPVKYESDTWDWDGDANNPLNYGIVEFRTKPADNVLYQPAIEFDPRPNLKALKLSGRSHPIIVANRTGATSNAGTFHSNDELYVSWSFKNVAVGTPGPVFQTTLLIDGLARKSWSTDWDPEKPSWRYEDDYSIGKLSPGRHKIKIRTDSTNVIEEVNENDNFSETTIIVRPQNDEFANAITIAGDSTNSGTNAEATKQVLEPRHAGNNGGKSVWWKWTAPANGSVAMDTIGSNFDTTLAVYKGGSFATLSLIKQDNDGGTARTSKVTFNAKKGTTYRIAVDGYNGASGNIKLSLNSDLNDSIAEATALPSLSIGNLGPANVFATSGSINLSSDVDIYKVTVSAGQKWGFDIDRSANSTFDSYLRLFNANGNQLAANDDAAGVGESSWRDSYISYTFATGGDYYIGVSGYGNSNYNPVNGTGESVGSIGDYRLYAAPVAYVSGFVERNFLNLTAPLIHISPNSIDASLHRIDGGLNDGIVGGRTTWVVIHGRIDNQDSFVDSQVETSPQRLASALAAYNEGDQVLTLDWRRGASDNSSSALGTWGLEGNRWIKGVAAWATASIRALNLSPDQINLVGHSWGSYVAYEIAKSLKSSTSDNVRSIVALDPANNASGPFVNGGGYNASKVDFAKYSDRAWSFYGNGWFGYRKTAETADESFVIAPYTGASSTLSVKGNLARHRAPVTLFTEIIKRNTPQPAHTWHSWFNLGRLLMNRAGPWFLNQYDGSGTRTLANGKFEGVIQAKFEGDAGSSSDRNDIEKWDFFNIRFKEII